MKILFIGEIKDLPMEGMLTIFKKVVGHFDEKNQAYVNDITKLKSAKIINIHSSGFIELLRNLRYKKKIIYCVHSNLKIPRLKFIYDIFQFYSKLYSKSEDHFSLFQRVRKVTFLIISIFIPFWFKRLILSKARKVVVANVSLERQLRLKNSIVIHQGIDLNKFKPKLDTDSGPKLNLSFMGHASPNKGFFEVIESFSKINEYHFDKNIFLTNNNQRIEKYIAKKDKSINVFGVRNDILVDYQEADITVLPFRHSFAAIATPLVLLEAMACGKAIITTDLPHIREICGDSVIYVKAYSPMKIINAIDYLAKNKELRTDIGKKARERVEKYYDQRSMFMGYENLFVKSLSLSEDVKF